MNVIKFKPLVEWLLCLIFLWFISWLAITIYWARFSSVLSYKLGLQILITEIDYLSHVNMGIEETVEREWYWVQPTCLWNIIGSFEEVK